MATQRGRVFVRVFVDVNVRERRRVRVLTDKYTNTIVHMAKKETLA